MEIMVVAVMVLLVVIILFMGGGGPYFIVEVTVVVVVVVVVLIVIVMVMKVQMMVVMVVVVVMVVETVVLVAVVVVQCLLNMVERVAMCCCLHPVGVGEMSIESMRTWPQEEPLEFLVWMWALLEETPGEEDRCSGVVSWGSSAWTQHAGGQSSRLERRCQHRVEAGQARGTAGTAVGEETGGEAWAWAQWSWKTPLGGGV